MLDPVTQGLAYLQSQSGASLLALFWFVILFEIPRYTLSFLAVAFTAPKRDVAAADLRPLGKISVIIGGHNEEHAVEACIDSLWAQSLTPDEIIVVSDGSTDRMRAKLGQLLRQGRIHGAHGTELRAGKSAATNLAFRLATGDIVINVDCDCSFDRHALRDIVAPFLDPQVGAVSGNILVRNARTSLVATFQAIEYLISISLGKRALGMIGQVCCASGAFGAFRTNALEQVGGLDAGGGEDLDVTLRLRRAGWKIGFAEKAICYTDTPATMTALTKQRFRWERDAVRLRYRKYIGLINPFSKRFQPMELLHEFEFLLFNVIGAVALPLYCLWLFATFGELAFVILIGAQAGLLLVDFLVLLLAAHATPRAEAARLFFFLPAYSLFNGIFMRFIRLAAYIQEWIYDASYADSYVPVKVHQQRGYH